MQAFLNGTLYHIDMAKVASRLRALREASGLTLRELARQIGEDHSNVGYWERSGKIPRSDVLAPIAKALGVTVEELLGEPKPRRAKPAGGHLGQLFDAASKLPRRQQQKIVELLQPFVREHSNEVTANGH